MKSGADPGQHGW